MPTRRHCIEKRSSHGELKRRREEKKRKKREKEKERERERVQALLDRLIPALPDLTKTRGQEAEVLATTWLIFAEGIKKFDPKHILTSRLT